MWGWRPVLGWIGRNNLLVHPRFGARVRYNTVLTDIGFDNGCGTLLSLFGLRRGVPAPILMNRKPLDAAHAARASTSARPQQ